MKIDTEELKGQQLNWAVASAIGLLVCIEKTKQTKVLVRVPTDGADCKWIEWNPVENWSQAGPIIEELAIPVWRNEIRDGSGAYAGFLSLVPLRPNPSPSPSTGSTILEAMMKAVVVFKYGQDVEVPDELFGEEKCGFLFS